jgi:hypothetical protein
MSYTWLGEDSCCGDDICSGIERYENCPDDCVNPIPEFNGIAIIAILVIVAIALMFIMRKKK